MTSQSQPSSVPLDRDRLQNTPVGSKGRVRGYQEEASSYKRKLLSMVLTPGIEFEVIQQAPLRDPVKPRCGVLH